MVWKLNAGNLSWQATASKVEEGNHLESKQLESHAAMLLVAVCEHPFLLRQGLQQLPQLRAKK